MCNQQSGNKGTLARYAAAFAAVLLLSAMGLARATVLDSHEKSRSVAHEEVRSIGGGRAPARRELAVAPTPITREPTALSKELRARGYNACYMPDVGFGRYSHWRRIGSGAQMVVPQRGGHASDWGYDVIIHFHGHEAVRGPFIEAVRGAVLVGIDLGVASGPYSKAFQDPSAFERLLSNIQAGLRQASSRPEAHIRRMALSSWSAGFGAVTRILAQHPGAIDSVVLLDSLHSDYAKPSPGDPRGLHRVAPGPIEPVIALAERAVRNDAILYLSHSEIVPPGYASTTEVAHYLIERVAGSRTAGEGANPLGAKLLTRFDRGGLHVRGYQGGDKPAHCAHVELLAEAVRDYLEPAWGTPEAEEIDGLGNGG